MHKVCPALMIRALVQLEARFGEYKPRVVSRQPLFLLLVRATSQSNYAAGLETVCPCSVDAVVHPFRY